MPELVARQFVEERGVWRSLLDIRAAAEELKLATHDDDELRHARRLPKGSHAWLKAWEEEIVPAQVYCRHRGFSSETSLRLTAGSTPGVDVTIRGPNAVEQLELTVAQAARHDDWQQPGSTSPGAQEALRMEMLNTEGYVSTTDPLVRNKRTGHVEYEDELMARSPEEHIPEWVNGISLALLKKRDKQLADPSYGQGSILAVYGVGLSGDFVYPERGVTIDDLVKRLDPSTFTNSFEQTVLFGWHDGWFRNL